VADALDISAVQVFLQPLRRGSAARPLLAVGGAGLAQLGRVYALEPNPFTGDDDGITIDDRRRAGYVRLRHIAQHEQRQDGEDERYHPVRSQRPVFCSQYSRAER
jgi:hypothetical protein